MSAAGALVIPTRTMKGFEKLYGRIRPRLLPKGKSEVKGRLLSENQVIEVASILRKVGCIFEVVTIDVGVHSEEDLISHKSSQAIGMTAQLTSEHHPDVA